MNTFFINNYFNLVDRQEILCLTEYLLRDQQHRLYVLTLALTDRTRKSGKPEVLVLEMTLKVTEFKEYCSR
jgi:hypothetical protein